MPTRMNLRQVVRLLAIVALTVAIRPIHNTQGEPPKPASLVDHKQRIPWTTSRVQGSPEPPLPYITERVFPSLKFENCLDMAPMPGSDRLFVVEQGGKIYSFPRRADVKTADLAANLREQIPGVEQVYAIAFHPRFNENRYCYVCYIKGNELPDGSHIARFRVTDTDPPKLDVKSETTVLTWLSGGHNGCCLKFGLDGFLYISTGDGTPPNPPDGRRAGQDVSNLLSAILRIDVDHSEGDKNYRIPPDNPFVSLKGARGEIWAYGLRNPWRMSFDRKTGDLWVGDVGWERWEMLNRIERGGNYGWAVMEGRESTNPEWARGPTPILPPTIDHPHSESSSITDGLTYYGSRLKELNGHHIYSDYDTGKFWAFRFENGKVVDHREIADTIHRVVGFGEDQDGECYILDHTAGTIHRLIKNPVAGQVSRFPKKLSESGLFADVVAQAPAPGVLAYSVKCPPWTDHATAERWVALPGTSTIKAEGGTWTFPTDSVLVKTISLEMEEGNPASRRRIETQILHNDGIDWQPYTYQWNDSQTDAVLLGATGAERTIEVADRDAAGGKRRQLWRFSGRAECQRCHNKWSGPPLGFSAGQLDRSFDDANPSESQLEVFANLKLLDRLVPPKDRVPMAAPGDRSASLDQRVRSYLHVNCSHCHRMHAGSAVLSKMTIDLPLDKTDMLNVRPTLGTFGIHDARVIAPGDPDRSVLLYRMSKLGSGRMPHVGSTEVDREAIELVREWLAAIPNPAPKDPALVQRRSAEEGDLDSLKRGEDSKHLAVVVDRLLGSTSAALELLRSVDKKDLSPPVMAMVIEKGSHHADPSIRDLFERFLPPDQRVQRLGSVMKVDQLLATPGDTARGKEVFFNTAGIACKNCHRIGNEGGEVGPDLTTIGKKYNRPQLLESILEPSKFIDSKYVSYLVETKDGQVKTGLLTERNAKGVVLRDAQNQLHRIPTADLEQLVTQQQSLMPELLLRDMTARQVADLLAYLESLK